MTSFTRCALAVVVSVMVSPAFSSFTVPQPVLASRAIVSARVVRNAAASFTRSEMSAVVVASFIETPITAPPSIMPSMDCAFTMHSSQAFFSSGVLPMVTSASSMVSLSLYIVIMALVEMPA